MAVSDIHYKNEPTVERERFAAAINIAQRISSEHPTYKNLDALCIVGDFANSGTRPQMKAIKATIDENLNPGTPYMMLLASHEFNGDGNGEQYARDIFTDIFSRECDDHRIINGFHFIFVSCTQGCHFREYQQNWVKEQLEIAAADDPHKPIFFFQHPHITDTVYGSIGWGEDELTAILMNYPQVIDFSGHSHAPVNDPRNVHQRHFTCFGTGTLSYFELDEFDKITGTVPPDANMAAQMLIVEADACGRVKVTPYDVLCDVPFPNEVVIEKPWDTDSFIYTDDRMKSTNRPYFPESAALNVNVEGGTAKFSFIQAKDDEEIYVDDYVLTVKNTEGVTVKRVCEFSKYYLTKMPEVFTMEAAELAPGKYTAEVRANSFWRVKSAPITAAFEIK